MSQHKKNKCDFDSTSQFFFVIKKCCCSSKWKSLCLNMEIWKIREKLPVSHCRDCSVITKQELFVNSKKWTKWQNQKIIMQSFYFDGIRRKFKTHCLGFSFVEQNLLILKSQLIKLKHKLSVLECSTSFLDYLFRLCEHTRTGIFQIRLT